MVKRLFALFEYWPVGPPGSVTEAEQALEVGAVPLAGITTFVQKVFKGL